MSSGNETPWKIRRAMKTAFFLATMIASLLSLLVFTAPLLLILTDTMIPWALFYSLTPFRSMQSLPTLLQNYDFRSSLIDIPLISAGRSLVILCVYSLCDGRSLSYGPYVGTTVLCSVASASVVVLKACFYGGSGGESGGFACHRRLQRVTVGGHASRHHHHHHHEDIDGTYSGWSWKSAGMQMMVMCSVALALGHIAAAYRTRRRERERNSFCSETTSNLFWLTKSGGLVGVYHSNKGVK